MPSDDATIDGLLTAHGFAEDQRRDRRRDPPLGAFVGWVDTAWPHPSTPVLRFQDVHHIPRPDAQPVELLHALEAVRAARTGARRTCQFCQAVDTPGRMHDNKTC
jgi:hypothetical protein